MVRVEQAAANAVFRGAGAIVSASGTWAAGDTFLLMSDALAAMFLHASGASAQSPLNVLRFDRNPLAFRQWVHSARSEQLLRIDDVSPATLESLVVSPDGLHLAATGCDGSIWMRRLAKQNQFSARACSSQTG